MNTHFNQVGSSPRRNNHHFNTIPHSRHVAATSEGKQGPYPVASINPHEGVEARPAVSDTFDQHYASANDNNQYYGFDLQGNRPQPQQHHFAGSHSSTATDDELLRGLANYAPSSSPCLQHFEGLVLLPDHAFPPSTILPSPNSAVGNSDPHTMSCSPRLITEQQNYTQHEAAPVRQSRYEPFRHRFHSAEEARNHRRRGTRFDRTPYCDPKTDDTITEVEQDRIGNVRRIYNAMTSGEVARDNPGSIAMKRWVSDAHYPPDLVEAYAHKVFDCLMQQAKEGFRGWIHNDYVADERKGDDIDKDVDCAGRLENVILALQQEKTICEDVMNSACQIRMFVNAPRAYSNRKHQNRIGNSKRGRTKDTPDPTPKASKARRTVSGRTRAQSTSMSTLHASRESTPQQPQLQTLQRPPLAPPYYSSPASQQLSPTPNLTKSYSVAHGLPLHGTSMSASRPASTQHGPAAMSPATPSPRMLHVPQSHIPRMTTEPPHHTQPSFTFSSPLHGLQPASAPASPDNVKPVSAAITEDVTANFESHLDMHHDAFWLQSGASIDPALAHWDLPSLYAPAEGYSGADIFSEQNNSAYLNMPQIERPTRDDAMSGSTDQNGFDDLWGMQERMQHFPSSPASGGHDGEQKGS